MYIYYEDIEWGAIFLMSLKYKLMGFASSVQTLLFIEKNKCHHCSISGDLLNSFSGGENPGVSWLSALSRGHSQYSITL